MSETADNSNTFDSNDFFKKFEELQKMAEKQDRGWICPKCGKVNAPWVSECDCSRTNYYPMPYCPYPYPPQYPWYWGYTWC